MAPYEACEKRLTRVTSLSLVRYRTNDYSVPTEWGHREVLVKGFVEEVVIVAGSEVIARHARSYELEDLIFDPLHYLALLEQKPNALDQAKPLAAWDLPQCFVELRRLMEARLAKKGKREYVQVLRLLETFAQNEVAAAIDDALRLGTISFDAVKHLLLGRIEQRPPRLDLENYPHLPLPNVATTQASDGTGTVRLGIAAHITAASPGGPRYDPTLTPEDRRSEKNGIWLCRVCDGYVDRDSGKFPTDLLRNWKLRAENAARMELPSVDSGDAAVMLECVLRGHSNYVWDVAITPDGRRVLSASNDFSVKMWDLASKNLLATFEGHASPVCSISISSNGLRLATGALDGSVIVFDLSSTKEVSRLSHGAGDAKVSWGPKEEFLTTGGSDGVLRIWDLRQFAAIAELKAHDDPILKVLCVDDDRIASVSADRTLKICSLSSKGCLSTLEGHTGEVNSVAVCGARRRAASASGDCTIKLWDLQAATCVATLYGHTDIAWRVAITPDGTRIASGSADNTVMLWDADRACLLKELRHDDCVATVAFSPDGTHLAVGCDDHCVYIYSLL